MANRFLRLVSEGKLRSVEDLKSAFKAQARETHPDLAGSGADAQAFVKLRRDYEEALERLGRPLPVQAAEGDYAPPPGTGPDEWLPALEALLKRGFPKTPRHAKERERYAEALVRARSALAARDRELAAAFAALEAELEKSDSGADTLKRLARGALDALADGEAAGLAAAGFELRSVAAVQVLGGGPLPAEPGKGERLGRAATDFLSRLLELGGRRGD